MSDGFFFALAGLAAAAMIALALVWPQGLGTPSPGPFRRPMAVEAPPAATIQLKGAL